jgi:hypothetical protein
MRKQFATASWMRFNLIEDAMMVLLTESYSQLITSTWIIITRCHFILHRNLIKLSCQAYRTMRIPTPLTLLFLIVVHP